MKKLVFMALAFMLVLAGSAQAQYRYRKDVRKEQYEKSYEKWEKDQPKLRISNLKFALVNEKQKNRTNSASQKLYRKEESLRTKIANENSN